MDDLEQALVEAWERVSRRLGLRPWEQGTRLQRVLRGETRRPVRAWCLALRASDLRIGPADAASSADGEAMGQKRSHTLTIRGPRLSAWVKPVVLGGERTLDEVAVKTGRDKRTLNQWVKKGLLQGEKRYDPAVQRRRRWYVTTGGPIDPQADCGHPPTGWWAGAWLGHHERIPGKFAQRVERVPRLRPEPDYVPVHPETYESTAETVMFSQLPPLEKPWPLGGQSRFVGWDFKCPGRKLSDGRVLSCGRLCKKLWMPLPVWTVQDYLKVRGGTFWQDLPRLNFGHTRLVCSACLGVRYDVMSSSPLEAWNHFVTAVTGGLMYGREVVPPKAYMVQEIANPRRHYAEARAAGA